MYRLVLKPKSVGALVGSLLTLQTAYAVKLDSNRSNRVVLKRAMLK